MNIAVITGASSGMGKEFVLQLENHFKVDEVWVIARRKEKLEELQSFLKHTKVRVIPLDLTKEESFVTYKELLKKENPDIKLLVNASGIGYFGKYENIPLEDELKTIDLNVKAYVSMTSISLPYVHEGGNLVFIGSLSAFQPVPYETVYGATKAFMLSYTRSLSMELKERKIRVLSVNPGWVMSEFFANATQTNKDNTVKYYNKIYYPKDVVQLAYKDLLHSKKHISMLGFGNRMQTRLVKFMPVNFVMKTWVKQNKKAKNADIVNNAK